MHFMSDVFRAVSDAVIEGEVEAVSKAVQKAFEILETHKSEALPHGIESAIEAIAPRAGKQLAEMHPTARWIPADAVG